MSAVEPEPVLAPRTATTNSSAWDSAAVGPTVGVKSEALFAEFAAVRSSTAPDRSPETSKATSLPQETALKSAWMA